MLGGDLDGNGMLPDEFTDWLVPPRSGPGAGGPADQDPLLDSALFPGSPLNTVGGPLIGGVRATAAQLAVPLGVAAVAASWPAHRHGATAWAQGTTAHVFGGRGVELLSGSLLGNLGMGKQVRTTPSRPRSWAKSSLLYSCTPAGMHGPTCIFWANLTPFSLKARVR
jgi:hypothetical protein